MLRSWAWVALAAVLFACGSVRDDAREPAPGSGGAPASGGTTGSGATSSGAVPGAGGIVQTGGRFGDGGSGTGGFIDIGFPSGGNGVSPPSPWIYGTDGGVPESGTCPEIPSAPAHECAPKATAGTTRGACYDSSGGFSTNIVLAYGYPAGCRVALPKPAANGCGPQICTCTEGVLYPDTAQPMADWVCAP